MRSLIDVKSGATEMYCSVLIVGFSYEHTPKQDLSLDTYMKAHARIFTGEKPFICLKISNLVAFMRTQERSPYHAMNLIEDFLPYQIYKDVWELGTHTGEKPCTHSRTHSRTHPPTDSLTPKMEKYSCFRPTS